MFVKRASVGLLAALLLLTAAAADAGWQQARASGATARAYAIRVVVPGQLGAETPTVTAPEDSVVFSGSFDYNKLVTSGSANASASAVAGSLGERNRICGGQQPQRVRRRDHRHERRRAGPRRSPCRRRKGGHLRLGGHGPRRTRPARDGNVRPARRLGLAHHRCRRRQRISRHRLPRERHCARDQAHRRARRSPGRDDDPRRLRGGCGPGCSARAASPGSEAAEGQVRQRSPGRRRSRRRGSRPFASRRTSRRS